MKGFFRKNWGETGYNKKDETEFIRQNIKLKKIEYKSEDNIGY